VCACHNTGPTICTTAACVEAASNLIQSIAPEVDPCDDFFEFACSHWNRWAIFIATTNVCMLRDHPIPDDTPIFGTFNLVKNRVYQQLRGKAPVLDHACDVRLLLVVCHQSLPHHHPTRSLLVTLCARLTCTDPVLVCARLCGYTHHHHQ
jgi:hypothetical protein